MKTKLDGNVQKPDTPDVLPPADGRQGTRRVSVPISVAVAVLLLLILQASSVVLLIVRLNHQSAVSGPPALPSATFLRTDTVTQGTWRKVYGFGGYAIAKDREKFPSYARVGIPDATHTTLWIDDIDETRALQKARGLKRIAPGWFAWDSFTIDVDLHDDRTHRIALYLLDWDSDARAETIELLDGTNSQPLDTRQASKFNQGEYLVWKISGHVIVRVTRTAGANAVISGLFLD